MRAVVLFARYMGMRSIPEKTMDRLRHDPYFRYCFYLLNMHGTVYDKDSRIGKEFREGMLRLLCDPDSMTDKDLYLGLQQYLNNFIGYLPGGYRVGMFKEIAETSARFKRIFKAVDGVLEEKGLTEKAAVLRAEGKKVEFLKLALNIFNVLVERDGFDPRELWT